jgi:hypothetical protein
MLSKELFFSLVVVSETFSGKTKDLRHDLSSKLPGKTKTLDFSSENPWERAKKRDPTKMKKKTNELAPIIPKREMHMKIEEIESEENPMDRAKKKPERERGEEGEKKQENEMIGQ